MIVGECHRRVSGTLDHQGTVYVNYAICLGDHRHVFLNGKGDAFQYGHITGQIIHVSGFPIGIDRDIT